MRQALYCLLICLLAFQSKGQRQRQPGIVGIGISGGAMNYKGDLDDHLSLKFTRPGFGIHFSILPESKFNVAINYIHGSLECDDYKADLPGNKFRNLSFYSNLDEVSTFLIFRFQNKKNSFTARQKFVPYLFAGFGYFHFNPKRKVDGVEYELQKIGTEGQYLFESKNNQGVYPQPYKLWEFSIPYGLGLKFKCNKIIDIGIECGLRKTFTDYLDDVSGRYPDKQELLLEEGSVALYLSDPSNDPRRPNGRNNFSNRGNKGAYDAFIYTNFSVTYYFVTKFFKARQVYTF